MPSTEVMRGVRRYDRGVVKSKPRRDDSNGFLHVTASVTRAPAVFTYRNADGSERREFRPAEHVFSRDNIKRMSTSPVTLEHPPVRVTTENAKVYQVGYAAGDVVVEDDHAWVNFVITDENAIDALASGVSETSCGYDCDVVHEPGVFVADDGTEFPYDYIQINHRNNHHAICKAGRAGTTRVVVDSADRNDAYQVESENTDMPNEKTATVRLDDRIELQLDHADARAISEVLAKRDATEEELKAQIAELAAALEAKQAELSAMMAERDAALEAAPSEDEEAMPEEAKQDAINQLVEQRLSLFEAARPHFDSARWDEIKRMSEDDIKRETIKAAKPGLSLDGKDEHYVRAMFDIVRDEPGHGSRKLASASVRSLSRDSVESGSLTERINASIARRDSAWQRPAACGYTAEGPVKGKQ